MHEHRDDEIVSYLRKGMMRHTDLAGDGADLTSQLLMVMNSGSGFSHEEEVPSEEVEMLQIFIRPSQPGLAPGLQYISLDEERSWGAWRLIVGPEGSKAEATVRQQAWIWDAALEEGQLLSTSPSEMVQLLYVFGGSPFCLGQRLQPGDSLLLEPNDIDLEIEGPGDLVLFQLDPSAPFSRAGTIGG